MLPATARLPDVQTLIDQKAYFGVHGARQSGKTTPAGPAVTVIRA